MALTDPFPPQVNTSGLDLDNQCVLPEISVPKPLVEPFTVSRLSVPEGIMHNGFYEIAAQHQMIR